MFVCIHPRLSIYIIQRAAGLITVFITSRTLWKINNKMTLLFPTKAVPWTSTSNNNDLIGLFEIYSSDVFHYYNIKLFLNFIYFLTTDKVQQSTEYRYAGDPFSERKSENPCKTQICILVMMNKKYVINWPWFGKWTNHSYTCMFCFCGFKIS